MFKSIPQTSADFSPKSAQKMQKKSQQIPSGPSHVLSLPGAPSEPGLPPPPLQNKKGA